MRVLLLPLLLLFAACGTPPTPTAQAPATSDPHTTVHLFEWRWDDIAQECEAVLGPAGYDAVQVSPVIENALVEGRPWWERYQTVTYEVGNRSGSREAFGEMVERCRDAGVDIYVDVIINHMTGVYEGVSINGTPFGEYEYPGLYTYDDFHHCGLTEGDEIVDFNDVEQVRRCELVNLADLDTGTEKVRATTSAFLNDLLSLGVAGFRIDTGRHMSPEDVTAILDRVDSTSFIVQEIIDPEPPTWSEPYYAIGHITEFQYGYTIGRTFRQQELGRLHGENSVWETTPFLPSEKAYVFIDNHDNQRGHGGGGDVLTFKDEDLHTLANAFMLAHPYGRPRVMSSYAFETDRQGPPTLDGTEDIRPVYGDDGMGCGNGGWVCEHRDPRLIGMVQFREATKTAPTVTHWWTNGTTQMAFARGDQGFVAFNIDPDASLREIVQTGLEPGTYCSLTPTTSDEPTAEAEDCPESRRVVVDADGQATLDLAPMQVLALVADAG